MSINDLLILVCFRSNGCLIVKNRKQELTLVIFGYLQGGVCWAAMRYLTVFLSVTLDCASIYLHAFMHPR